MESAASTTINLDYIRLKSSTGSTTTYLYDHTNQRTAVTDSQGTTIYPNKLYTIQGSTTEKHLFAGDMLLATIENDNGATSTFTIHRDHLGGTNAVTDEEGTLAQALDYYPYGAIRNNASTGFDEKNKFTGHQFDEDAGLYYMQARYQEPEWGRFVGQDPAHLLLGTPAFKKRYGITQEAHLANPQALNSYTYAQNSPLSAVDVSGEIVSYVARSVPGIPFGVHFFWHIQPTIGPSQQGNELYQGSEFTLGAYNRKGSDTSKSAGWKDAFNNVLTKDIGYANDPTPNTDWAGGTVVNLGFDRVTIVPPKGVSEVVLVKKLLQAFWAIPDKQSYNVLFNTSNNFAYEIGLRAGIENQIIDFDPFGLHPRSTWPTTSNFVGVSVVAPKSVNSTAPLRGGGWEGYAKRRGLLK